MRVRSHRAYAHANFYTTNILHEFENIVNTYCSNGAEATTTRGCVLPRASLVLTITTAQKIFAINSSKDKISCHNFARLSAWCWRALHASGIFQIFLLSLRGATNVATWQSSGAKCGLRLDSSALLGMTKGIMQFRIVSRPCSDYNKLYFDKNFAFTLEIAAFSM